MRVLTVSQHSVFLINEPGALKKFANILFDAGLDIVGLSSDVRYEAAVVKFVLSEPKDDDRASQLITKGGYTSVKNEIICVEIISQPGVMVKISSMLGDNGINITAIYGSAVAGDMSRMFIVVDDIDRAIEILKKAQDEKQ